MVVVVVVVVVVVIVVLVVVIVVLVVVIVVLVVVIVVLVVMVMVVVVVAGLCGCGWLLCSDATRICRSWKYRSIRIAILNLFQCLPQLFKITKIFTYTPLMTEDIYKILF